MTRSAGIGPISKALAIQELDELEKLKRFSRVDRTTPMSPLAVFWKQLDRLSQTTKTTIVFRHCSRGGLHPKHPYLRSASIAFLSSPTDDLWSEGARDNVSSPFSALVDMSLQQADCNSTRFYSDSTWVK